MKTIVISIINFNGRENTIACLRSLAKAKEFEFYLDIVVVDNGSEVSMTQKDITMGRLPVYLIQSKKNLGFSGGHNLGIKYALAQDADYVVILNNDTVVDAHFLEEMYKAAKSDERIGIVAPKIYFAKGSEFHKTRYKESELGNVIWYAGGQMDWKNVLGVHRGVDEVDTSQYDTAEPTGYASGCCMMIRKEILKKVGGFDERYFLYYEDIDLNERIKKAGYTVMYVPSAKLWHRNAASSGGSGSPLQDYYISRNRMLLGMTYAPLRTKIALFRESMRIWLFGRPWQKKGIQDYYAKNLGKGSYKRE